MNGPAQAITGLLGVLLFVTMANGAPQKQAKDAVPTVRVYVFTAPTTGGFVDEESSRRNDSVKDLREVIAKSKNLASVETTAEADITLEVLISAKAEDPNAAKANVSVTPGILGGKDVTTTKEAVLLPKLVTKLSVPGTQYSTLLELQDQRLWKDLAGVLVDQKLQKWIKANGAQLRSQHN